MMQAKAPTSKSGVDSIMPYWMAMRNLFSWNFAAMG